MIETRAKQILDFLTTDYKFHTSEDIGKSVGLSSKSAQKEINTLNSIICDEGAIIKSEPGKGYQFKITNNSTFKSFLKTDWYKYAYYHHESGNKKLRIESIIKLMLFSNSYLKQQELADMYYVSHSQINKDIKEVRDILRNYNLKLISKPYYGMKVVGEEKNIRLALRHEIGEDPNLFRNDEDELLFNTIQEVINGIEFPQTFYMPYANFKNLVVHIYISILRISEGKYVKVPEELSTRVISYEEFSMANLIVAKLSSQLDLDFPKDEILYLTMHMITKNSVTNYEKVSPEISEIAQQMIDEAYDVTKYDFRSNIDLFFALSLHLGPLIERIRYGLNMKNPILDDIKENQVAFMLATIAVQPVNKRLKTKLSDDEIGYISLHIASAMDYNVGIKRNILVVCGSGNSSAQMMKSQLERKYKDQIENLTLTNLSRLKLYKLDNFAFIVSSVDIKEKTTTPIVYVDVIFKQRDFENIDNIFNRQTLNEIDKLFSNSIFLKDIDVDSIDQTINILADYAFKKSKLEKNYLIDQFKKREELGPTAYINVAIPHILDKYSKESFCIILIPKNKISWDEVNVNLVISIFFGNDLNFESKFLDNLGRFLNNAELIEKSTKSNNIEEFKNIFLES